MAVTDLWAKMFLRFDEDPKIVALARYGDEAGLCRDLYLAMVRYCRRNLTDGFVPSFELMRLAFPLALPMAERIAKHLVSEELCAEVANGWVVSAYVKRNGTRAQQEAKSETARQLARRRWADANGTADGTANRTANRIDPPGADRTAGGNAEPSADGNAEVETEVEDRRGPDRHASAQARGQAREDDDDSINRIFAMLHAHGPISREQVIAYRDSVTAGRRIEDPGRYVIAAIRKDPKAAYREAIAATGAAPTRLPPPPSMLCRRCGLQGHREADCTKPPPSEDSSKHGAAAARAGLADRPRTTQAAALGEDSTDPTGSGLHGEELARAQLAASRLGGSIIGVEPGAATTTAEPEEGDEEFDPPF